MGIMTELDTDYVYLMGGSKEEGDLYVWEVYPEEKPTFDKAIRGRNAELIASAADVELMSINSPDFESMECIVYDKQGNVIGRTPKRRPVVYQDVAQDVAKILGKKRVKILIR